MSDEQRYFNINPPYPCVNPALLILDNSSSTQSSTRPRGNYRQPEASRRQQPTFYDPHITDHVGGGIAYGSNQYEHPVNEYRSDDPEPSIYRDRDNGFRIQMPSAVPFTPEAALQTRSERTTSKRSRKLTPQPAWQQSDHIYYVPSRDAVSSNAPAQRGSERGSDRGDVPPYNSNSLHAYSAGNARPDLDAYYGRPCHTSPSHLCSSNGSQQTTYQPSAYQPGSDTQTADWFMHVPDGRNTQIYKPAPMQFETATQPRRPPDYPLPPRTGQRDARQPHPVIGVQTSGSSSGNYSATPSSSQGREPPRYLPPPPPSLRRPLLTNRAPWECTHDGCGKTFTRESDLDRHIDTKHGDTYYKCRTCGRENDREDKMRKHCRDKGHNPPNVEWYRTLTDTQR